MGQILIFLLDVVEVADDGFVLFEDVLESFEFDFGILEALFLFLGELQ